VNFSMKFMRPKSDARRPPLPAALDCRGVDGSAGLDGGGGALPLPYGIAQIWERLAIVPELHDLP